MDYASLTWPDIRDFPKERTVVMIPTGAVEQHGPHLSLATDTVLVTEVARRVADRARGRAEVLVTPTFWCGCSEHHMEFPGTLTLSVETFVRAVTEIGLSVVKHGFRRLLILNGHGHNLDPIRIVARAIRETAGEDVLVAAANYWHFALEEIKAIRESGVGGIAHACEFETSCMLAAHPAGVTMSKAERHVPVWNTPFFSMDFNVSRSIYVAHHVADFSPKGVFGDPTLATAEKGERFLHAVAGRIADFLADFVAWTYAGLYRIEPV